ncbi:MAG: DUF4271 domain-containing protein, partial [Bacteroidales bacterium]|nr:DUF4271 domain-containing protein [Bacteroidales bacterium]
PDTTYAEAEGQRSFFVQELAETFVRQPHIQTGFDWFFAVFVLFLSLLAFIKMQSLRFSGLSHHVFANRIHTVAKYNINNQSATGLRYPFVLCIWITFSLLLYTFIGCLTNVETNVVLLRSFVLIAGFLGFRWMLVHIVGFLFKTRRLLTEFGHSLLVLHFVSAVFAFPFLCMNYYHPSFYLTGFVVILYAVFLIRMLIEGWQIVGKKFRLFEYFLYFCTVEILPILVLLKSVTVRL